MVCTTIIILDDMSINNNLPSEIEEFKSKRNVTIIDWERYENIFEVQFLNKDNEKRTVYIRVHKENRMSDADAKI